MAVTVTDRVWQEWSRVADTHERAMRLVVEGPAGPRRIASVLHDSLLRSYDDADTGKFPGAAHGSEIGEWGHVISGSRVAVTVLFSDVFEDTMARIVDDLDRVGLDATIDLDDALDAPEPPIRAPMIVCQARVRGHREHPEPRVYEWTPAVAALEATISSAERWCRVGPRCSLQIHSDPVPIKPGFGVADQLIDAGRIGMRAVLTNADHATRRPVETGIQPYGEPACRCVSVGPVGQLVLAVTGVTKGDEGDGWHAIVMQLRTWLLANADELAYAYVRRGWDVGTAIYGPGLGSDWPTRDRYEPQGAGFTYAAFEDVAAPDAFGMQLFGEGYADRPSPSAPWSVTTRGQARLVEHHNLEAWLTAPFVADKSTTDTPQPLASMELLEQARGDLAALLYTPSVPARFGAPDVA
jgi:hypothetical protein